MRSYFLSCLWLVLSLLAGHFLYAQDSSAVSVSYGKKGFELSTDDGNYKMQIQARFQFRYANPYDRNPSTYDQLNQSGRQVLKISRARFRIGGNAYKPYIKYYMDYDVNSNTLQDFRIMVEKWSWLKFKAGQWKIENSLESMVSSGKQSLADRSQINQYFTLSRQQGVSIYGNLGGERMENFTYHASVLTGAGRSARVNPTNDLMYSTRLQWNFCGKEMVIESSDTEIHNQGIGSIAISGTSYKGPYTLFSGSGGATLQAVPDSVTPHYSVKQISFETAYMKRGFSWQNETQLKIIEDEVTNSVTNLAGAYFQAAYFFHQLIPAFPERMEIAARYALYTPDLESGNQFQNEYSIGVNYFFKNHANKLTAEITRFEFEDPILGADGRYRFRLQWDILF